MAFLSPSLEALREAILGAAWTQNFGPTNNGYEPASPDNRYPHFHYGIDVVFGNNNGARGMGFTERALFSGRVIQAGYNDGFGNSVTIQGPSGFTILLGHLRDLYTREDRNGNPLVGSELKVGQTVTAGDIIGHQGSTGNSTGPHTHIQLRAPDGTLVDLSSIKNTSDLFSTIYHVMGFGTGYLPGQVAVPPGPSYRQAESIPTEQSLFGKWAIKIPLFQGQPGPQPIPIPGNGDCPSGTHRDQLTGVCVPDNPGTPIDCGPGNVWNASIGACVPASSTGIPGPIVGIGDILANPGTALNGVHQWLLSDVGPTLLVLSIGSVLILIGLIKLGKEKPVQTVIQPIQQTGKTVGETAAKVAAIAA